MNARRTLAFLLGIYGALTAYIYIRSWAGLPFQMGVVFAHPILAMVFVISHAGQREGWGNAARFAFLTLLLTLSVESLSVRTGFPFGFYHYSDKLGALFLGLVPYVIPIVWLNMLYPAYVIAARLTARVRASLQPWTTAALGGLIMTSWDLIVDPVMVQRGHWTWERAGAYFGIPLSNFFGWWLTSFAVLALYLRWRTTSRPLHTVNDGLAIAIYAITGLGNVAGGWVDGLPMPASIAFMAMTFWVVTAWRAMNDGSRAKAR